MDRGQSLEEAIRSEASRLGFAACGFTRADAADAAGLDLKRWLAAGHHGTMGWMEERAHHRVSPLALWPEARSAIALGMSYAPATDPMALAAHPEVGRISAYAQGGDYHKTVKKALKALARFIVEQAPSELKVFVDTAPVMEKPLAQAAGIGWQGKHTNLVSREHGSWLFLGVILTSLELTPDAPADHGQHCGTCTRCLAACPTNAFLGAHRIDARRCISYLTIEHDGPIPDELRTLMGNRIYGCDDCLAVCPWNRFAREGNLMKPHARTDLGTPDLIELLSLDESTFKQRFAGTPILRAKRRGFLRNVCVALGNVGDQSALLALKKAAGDAEPLIAEHAQWALSQIRERVQSCSTR